MSLDSHPRMTLVAAVLLLAACRGDRPFTVSIDAPADGASVQSPVSVMMSARGIQIERAGPVREGAGHFHLLIDTPCDAPGQVVSASPQRLRLEDGRARADVPLDVGDHTLCLQASDGRHGTLQATDTATIHVVAAPVASASSTTTSAPNAGPERWQGTTRGPFKAGPDCEPGLNTGEFVLELTNGRFTGRGTVSASQYSCRTPQGSTTIPAQSRDYTLTATKDASQFLLTFSNGPLTIRVPYANGRGSADLDQSVGAYIARSTITMRCVSGC